MHSITLDVLQSSAYSDTAFPGVTTSRWSLIKIRKKGGPSNEPLGTRDGIEHHLEFTPSVPTLCSLLVR